MCRFCSRPRVTGLLLCVALAVLVGCGEDSTDPKIDAVMPSTAAPGDTIELLGERFCGDAGVASDGACATQPAGSVSFGDGAVRGLVVAWGETRITVTVPSTTPLGATTIVVTVDGIPSNAIDFEVR